MAHSVMCHAFPYQLSQEDVEVLKVFFQALVENSEAGYVFNGVKPVCLEGFFKEDPLYIDSSLHKQSVAYREGLKKWIKLKPQLKDILIHAYNNHDSASEAYIHLLVINRPLFLETVEKNLPLFKYVLGPLVTPQKLLDALTSPTNNFSDVVKDDNVLTGILLGFGTINSINGSRLEEIEKLCVDSPDIPPFASSVQLIPGLNENYKNFLPFQSSEDLISNISDRLSQLQPSFGFNTIAEEYRALSTTSQVSSPKLTLSNRASYLVAGKMMM